MGVVHQSLPNNFDLFNQLYSFNKGIEITEILKPAKINSWAAEMRALGPSLEGRGRENSALSSQFGWPNS